MKKKIWAISVIAMFVLLALLTVNVQAETTETTLQGKIDATAEGGTLVLDDNYNEEVTITKDITIDFDGYTLTSDNHGIVVDNGATVTITGNGTISTTKGAIVNKNGQVTIENGEFTSEKWYTIKNLSNMTINDGYFTQTKHGANSSLIVNGWYYSTKTSTNDLNIAPPETVSAFLTINGGEFVHNNTTSTIKGDNWSETNITGGTFTSPEGFLVQVTGTVNISGGTFSGNKATAVIYREDAANGEANPCILTISGGTFTDNYLMRTDHNGVVTVTGGIFEFKDGLILDNSDGEAIVPLTVTGGTYSVNSNIEDYLDEGYTLNENRTVVPVVEEEPTTDDETTFPDVLTSAWYYNAVKYCKTNKIILGYEDGTFRPDTNITRGQFVTILWRMEGEPESTTTVSSLSDLSESSSYYKAILWAEENGIVKGYEDGTFRESTELNRQQLAEFLKRYSEYKGIDTSNVTSLDDFADSSSVDGYAVKAIQWAVANGVIKGYTEENTKYIRPTKSASRAEAAEMIYKFCTKILE